MIILGLKNKGNILFNTEVENGRFYRYFTSCELSNLTFQFLLILFCISIQNEICFYFLNFRSHSTDQFLIKFKLINEKR